MSDLPDFTNYSQVDLVQQTIAFLTNRPMYGEAKKIETQVTVKPNDYKTLLELTGKGMIYSGIVYTQTDHSIYSDFVILEIDDIEIFSLTWAVLLDYGMMRYGDFVVWLSEYNDKDYKYLLSIKNGLTFEEKIRIRYYESLGRTFHVNSCLVYTLVNT